MGQRSRRGKRNYERSTEDGVAWSGMEWHGVAWSGMEWHGVTWSGMEWHGMALSVSGLSVAILTENVDVDDGAR